MRATYQNPHPPGRGSSCVGEAARLPFSPHAEGRMDTVSQSRLAIIDLGPYLAGEAGALARAAAQLGAASEELGFYFVANHGIPQALIDRVFAEAERFHSLPLDQKLQVKVQGKRVVGYLPLG